MVKGEFRIWVMKSKGSHSPLIGEPLAVDFANTLVIHEGGDTADFLATTDQLSRWLEAESERLDHTGSVTRRDLSDFRVLRVAVRELFEALLAGDLPSEEAVGVVNASSARAPTYPEFDCSGAGEPQIRARSVAHGTTRALLAEVARSAIAIAGGPARNLLRVCEAPGCPQLFVATNPRRRWCSEPCGNRARVARHYRRTSSGRTVPTVRVPNEGAEPH